MKPLMMAVIVAAVYVEAGAAAIGGHQYIARKSLFVQPNASAPAPIKDVVVQLGGQVDFDLPRWLIMTIPDSALQTIREHPAVKYLQQVVSGPFVEPTSTATTARHVSSNGRVAGNSLPPWTSGTYKYDGAGNIWAIGNDTFTYDSLSRLAAANVKGVSETYTYDAFGNLTQKTTGTLTVGLPTDTATNHLTEQSYDAAGNLIGDSSETNAFDPVNMQREKDIPAASLAELYVYDASDERIGVIQCSGPPASCTDGKETWTFRDESGKVLRQYEGTSVGSSGFSFPNSEGAWAWIEDYVYRDNLLLAAELQPEEGGRRHFHLDHLGTARLVTGSAGQQLAQHDYYPFGVEVPPSFPETSAGYDREEPMRFTGHERDFNVGATTENSNYNDFMHARATIPQWGRFLSVDPTINVPRALHNPQAWNRYSYGLNNPMKYLDPDGKEAIIFIIGASNIARDLSGAFGHTAIWVSSGNRNNGVSFGGDFAFKRNGGYAAFLRAYQASGRSVHVFHLKTTPEQDAKMLQYIQQRPTPFTGFNMCTNNCATTTVDVLKAGGVIPGMVPVYDGSSGLTQRPNNYFTPEGLEAALDGGELSSIVQSQSTAPGMRNSDSSSSMSLDDLLQRMQMDWLFSDAFGTQLTVTPRK